MPIETMNYPKSHRAEWRGTFNAWYQVRVHSVKAILVVVLKICHIERLDSIHQGTKLLKDVGDALLQIDWQIGTIGTFLAEGRAIRKQLVLRFAGPRKSRLIGKKTYRKLLKVNSNLYFSKKSNQLKSRARWVSEPEELLIKAIEDGGNGVGASQERRRMHCRNDALVNCLRTMSGRFQG